MRKKTNTPLPQYNTLPTEPGYTINSGVTDYYKEKPNSKLNGLYGLTAALPLSLSKQGGFSLLVELKELVKQNFKNLILTEPGERIMDIEFGVGLRRYLFENKTEEELQNIYNRIHSQKNKYMSYITIEDIEFIDEDTDPNYLGVTIYYSIPELSISDTLDISLGE